MAVAVEEAVNPIHKIMVVGAEEQVALVLLAVVQLLAGVILKIITLVDGPAEQLIQLVGAELLEEVNVFVSDLQNGAVVEAELGKVVLTGGLAVALYMVALVVVLETVCLLVDVVALTAAVVVEIFTALGKVGVVKQPPQVVLEL